MIEVGARVIVGGTISGIVWSAPHKTFQNYFVDTGFDSDGEPICIEVQPHEIEIATNESP
jgi:hypothetical protein